MARKFPGGLSTGRSDVFHLDANSGSLIVDEKRFNVARWEPTTPAEVRELAESIVQKAEEKGLKEHGQLQPVKVRKLSATEYAVSAGFTRTKAIRLINADADFRQRLGLKPDEVYPLRAEVYNQNEDDAILDNIDENFQRFNASPMDKANVVAVLAARGWSDKRIAERFKWTANWIGQLKKLQSLDVPHQKLVHNGTLPIQAAIDLTDLNPDERESVIEAAKSENGKVNGQKVRSAKRDQAIQRAEQTGTAVTTKVSRSMKELRNFFGTQANPDTGNHELVQKMFGKLIDYSTGKCGERAVMNVINEMIKKVPAEAEEPAEAA